MSNPNLNLPTQEYPTTASVTLKPAVKASPVMVRLAAAVAAVRAQKSQTKPSSEFLP